MLRGVEVVAPVEVMDAGGLDVRVIEVVVPEVEGVIVEVVVVVRVEEDAWVRGRCRGRWCKAAQG